MLPLAHFVKTKRTMTDERATGLVVISHVPGGRVPHLNRAWSLHAVVGWPAAALRHQAATLPRRRLPPDNDREDGDGGGESTAAGGYQLIHLLIRYTN